jgi:hypothetical protein
MPSTRQSARNGNSNGKANAKTCRKLADEAYERAARTTDPDMRMTFLDMNELWLDLAKEIDRRQA